jgi:hypothetical protein
MRKICVGVIAYMLWANLAYSQTTTPGQPTTVSDQAVDPIRLPFIPDPEPVKPVNVDKPIKLDADQWFVVESHIDLITLSSKHCVKVTREKGPITLRGKLIGYGSGVRTKSFQGPFVFIVEYLKEGQDDLLLIPVGVKKSEEIKRLRFSTGNAIPDTPDDGDKSDKGDKKPPINAEGLKVMVVYDKSPALTPDQLNIINSTELQTFINGLSSCKDGQCFRSFPANVEITTDEKYWQDAMKRPRKSSPWIIISHSKKGGFEGPLPNSLDELKQLIKKYE